MSRRNWTEEEISILKRKKSEGLSYSEIQEFISNRTKEALKLKWNKLGLSEEKSKPWSEEEDEILKLKAKEPILLKDILPFLPSRTLKSVAWRLEQLKIDRSKTKKAATKEKRKQEYLKKLLEISQNFELTLDISNFEDRDSEIPYACKEGHSGTTSYKLLYDSTYGCEWCGKIAIGDKNRLTKKDILQSADELNLEIDLKNYRDPTQQFNAECRTCGYKFTTNGTRIRAQWNRKQKRENHHLTGCPKCNRKKAAQKNAQDIKYVRESLALVGIELLSETYNNNHEKLSVRYTDCRHVDNNHSWNELQYGLPCQTCKDNKKAKPSDYKKFANKNKGKVLFIPKTDALRARWECRYGHVFFRRFKDMRRFNTFCTTCNQNWGEGVCRSVLEYVFESSFPKIRPKDMRSPKGRPLELDCYNERLKIALEHNGMHHYKPQKNRGGREALVLQRKHDKIRREYCVRKGIALLTVPEVGSLTPLNQLTKVIANDLIINGREVPSKLKDLNIEALEIKTGRDYYVEEVKRAAKDLELKILEQIKGAEDPIKVLCSEGHTTPKTPRSITSGQKCAQCRLTKISKSVTLSDGRKFKSRTAAAESLGVNKTTVNRAVNHGRKIKGFSVFDSSETKA